MEKTLDDWIRQLLLDLCFEWFPNFERLGARGREYFDILVDPQALLGEVVDFLE